MQSMRIQFCCHISPARDSLHHTYLLTEPQSSSVANIAASSSGHHLS